ncbi:hypothetical protein E2C01_024923 [Portunus trituberculatus]|uniref:Uncharacterized protein n=1 Tax=Portunus trituberculatus TaxID=210409 RepID=A0A5B7EDR4_PORTR|nr:hypothetical protein [Portunus trituberculatus]
MKVKDVEIGPEFNSSDHRSLLFTINFDKAKKRITKNRYDDDDDDGDGEEEDEEERKAVAKS